MDWLSLILAAAVGLFLLLTMSRWLEQTAEAVGAGRWGRLACLLACPFSTWLFTTEADVTEKPTAPMPAAPPKRASAIAQDSGMAVDPARLKALREQMRRQGVLDDEPRDAK